MTFTAYDTDPHTDTVGVYSYSEESDQWYRIRTLPEHEH